MASTWGSKPWANELLRYGIVVLRKWWGSPESTRLQVYYKVQIINGLVDQLDRAGFWWQGQRLRNHLRRYLGNIALMGVGSNPTCNLQPKADLPTRQEAVSS